MNVPNGRRLIFWTKYCGFVKNFCGRLWEMVHQYVRSPLRLKNGRLGYSELKCRLERMERRMSLLKQKKAPASPQADADSTVASSPGRQARRDGENRGIKRRHTLEPQSLSKRFAAASRSDSPHRHRGALTPTPRNSTTRAEPPRVRDTRIPVPAYLDPKNIPKRPCDRYFESPENRVKTKMDMQKLLKLSQKRTRLLKNERLHRTSVMYYMPPVVPDVCELSSPPRAKKDPSVAVPTWRIKQIPKAYTLEGTENLGDDIYIRRHQKPENDEKRRKRWDIQQLREQKMVEKLRQSKSQSKTSRSQTQTSEKESDTQSLLPSLEDIKYLEVCDSIPVSAFGSPLPNLQSKTFDLPWFDPEKRRKEERTKSRSRKR